MVYRPKFYDIRGIFVKSLLILLALIPLVGFSLDVDEKLTLRILKISKSKRTILINRGIEDGLVEGDHAKFFDQSGVLARGKLSKISPARSVWSIYRIISEKEFKENKVLNLKITPEMKLTKDKSKELAPKNGIPARVRILDTEEDTKVDDREVVVEDKSEEIGGNKFYRNLDTRGDSLGQGRGIMNWSPWEVVGTLSYIGTTNTIEMSGQETKENSISNFDLILGVERYNPSSDNLWRRFSFLANIEWSSTSMENETFWEGSYPKDTFGLGLGTNWHFLNDPFAFDALIGFIGLGFGGGVRQFTMVEGTRAYLEETSFFSWNFGAGVKWYTKAGLGLRGIIEYFSRSGDSTFTEGGLVRSYKTSGPRFRIGASWRF
ncbi:MAG: hypothetical protein DRQ88_10480 [Epsilonproteobacteria bacterium]|nr:MAG: hypothetical protein DRQ88_10480 [Campylobacterota bacterium]RLA65837.1 MAG: hypothetical protein DRQ89_00360 [Campylobacterota bacterium]